MNAKEHPIYSVKNIKSFTGMEGRGYNATLYNGQRKIAGLIDDASGGPLIIRLTDQAEAEILDAYIQTLPDHVCNFLDPETGQPAVIKYSMELFLDDLVNLTEQVNKIKKSIKKRILFIQDGELYSINVDPSEKNKDIALKRHHNAILLNNVDEKELFRLMKDFV
jgi:hypothetical protein